jgi:hypothetical protein
VERDIHRKVELKSFRCTALGRSAAERWISRKKPLHMIATQAEATNTTRRSRDDRRLLRWVALQNSLVGPQRIGRTYNKTSVDSACNVTNSGYRGLPNGLPDSQLFWRPSVKPCVSC